MLRALAVFLLAILVVGGFFGGCSRQTDPWPNKPGKRVLATFPPIYCFAQNVAGDDAVVLCLLTAKGPHEADEWDAQDILKFRGADLVFANGLSLEKNLDKLETNAGKKVKIVKVADSIPTEKLLPFKEGKIVHDPHVWLSPALAMDMVDCIAEELSKLDPAHEIGFRARAKGYKATLKKELLDHGLDRFKEAENRNIVTQHDAIQYFAHVFDLKIVGSLRQTEGLEINAVEKNKLIQDCQNKHVRAVTCEPQYNSKEMESLCKSLGIESKLAVVDPLETAPTAPGSTNPDPACYVDEMRKNIDNLAEKLK